MVTLSRRLEETGLIEVDFGRSYRFDPLAYPVPAARIYSGKHDFKKHYYAAIGDLRYKRRRPLG
jgi:hypothetical protein